jgi:hypothetical protein
MENKQLKETLEDLDQRKVSVLLSYRLNSGKIESAATLIRALVKNEGCWFVLTERGIPFRSMRF